MRRTLLVALLFAPLACVEVPFAIRAQFAAPGPSERSNFRPGAHGTAPPVEEPEPPAPRELAVPDAAAASADGGVS